MYLLRNNNKLKNRVVYTVITSRYDELVNHAYMDPDWDYVCFSDINLKNDNNSKWKILPLRYSKTDISRSQRWHKLNSHLLFPKYAHSIYLDASVEILNKDFFVEVENKIKEKAIISMPRHPYRDCIYDELEACIALKKDAKDVMVEGVKYIESKGFPRHYGLWACGIIYRNHLEPAVVKLSRDWWGMISKYSRRDQLSFSYCAWKNNITVADMDICIDSANESRIRIWPHNNDSRNHIKMLENNISNLSRSADDLAEELGDIIQKLNSTTDKRDDIISAYESSLSWRLTKPLRHLKSLIYKK